MHELRNNLYTKDGWQIIEKSFNPEQYVTTGSNFMIGNGYLGYRGTLAEWEADRFVACTVTDTWDKAPDSEWRELCTVPNGLYTQLSVAGVDLSVFDNDNNIYSRSLDLKTGLYERSQIWNANNASLKMRIEKFASYANIHLVPMRISLEAQGAVEVTLKCGIDGRIWSLNGEHFTSYNNYFDGGLLGIETRTHEFDTQIDVVTGINVHGLSPQAVMVELIEEEKGIFQQFTFTLEGGTTVVIEQVMAVCHSNQVASPGETAIKDVELALSDGFDALFAAHSKKWEQIWEVSDIQISGNIEAQTLVRFNLYQATIATPTHAKLPIGARGLSCQVYQGAAFWDQETFNLPMYIYTRPEVARMLLEYRYDTLPGARNKAKRLGYYGAFYAWTSGKTGEELFPDYFFTDVLTGRKIRNHFNCWQIHISPDIVYALWLYYEASGDWDFIVNYGAEIAFEVAQFLVSRVHFKMDKKRYEVIRLLGPDEYHENVDNNTYTNYLVQYALQKAAYIFQRLQSEMPETLDAILKKIGVGHGVIGAWVDIATRIYLPQPDKETFLIEQHDGFLNLEDIRPKELKKRLIDPEEYWGWPNGIAVEAQVLKQADLLQLFALLDDKFEKDVMRANYDYYEPRTEHGSSLSPSVHSIIAARADYPDEAYRYFLEGSTIDLYNASKKVVSGGSFLGGIHTAAAGGAWQMIVKGFAGFKLIAGVLHFDPHLPKAWDELTFKIILRGSWLKVTLNANTLTLTSDSNNADELIVRVGELRSEVIPGRTLKVDL